MGKLGMVITKIVSGGQTGADRGGLEAAIYCNVPHGGWCPQGRKAEDGPIPEKYHQVEMAESGYLPRTEANVVDSDATVIFTIGRLAGGSMRTAEFAIAHRKPYFHVDLRHTSRKQAVVADIVNWLSGRGGYDYDDYESQIPKQGVLNVVGNRESKAGDIEHRR